MLEFFFDSQLPKSGLSEEDRQLLKTAVASHADYRDHCAGTGDCTWQASLSKSGIMTFELLQARDLKQTKIFLFDFLNLHNIAAIPVYDERNSSSRSRTTTP